MGTGSAESLSAAVECVCRDLAEGLLDGTVSSDEVEQVKLELCRAHDADRVPKHSEILNHAPDGRRDELAATLKRKPVRTASGVSPVAIMTSPAGCPHGKCLYCPGGPASEFSSAQSYTGHEPAAARGVQTDYDPYAQVTLRLEQLRNIGHPVEKVDLILMGGTMTARSHDYQEWFVKRALAAMNDYDPSGTPDPSHQAVMASLPDPPDFRYTEDVIAANETADVRCIGITFGTKPDWCGPEQIDRMLRLGGTNVYVGVQTTFDSINRDMHRGHGVPASIDANRRL
ncbi:MAG: radical SAM protein, partial [Halobacteriales archaeon]|nr:radical SAM protein [Halobacteriales archaeon]